MNNNLQPLKGFRDFLPAEAKARQWLRAQMITVFEKWGYEPLETPTLEPLELFSGQIGEDEKLFYKFKDWGDRDVMLRYDQTVPTCRVVAQNLNTLVYPFRRYQIQSNFRAEKPQKGRFREFTQADVDIIGVLGPEGDAETSAVSLDLYLSLGFKNVYIAVNNRRLMAGIPYPAIVAIDKLVKIGTDAVIAEMISKDITPDQSKEYLDQVNNLQPDETINAIFNYLNNYGFTQENYRFTPTLARSFSYSDGPIWEVIVPDYPGGSLGGGERYDGLLEKICSQNLGGTGIAFGFDRTLEACQQFGLVPGFPPTTKVLITVFSSDLFLKSLSLSQILRSNSIPTELYPDPAAKLDKQLKYASKKGIPYVAILGPEEIEKNVVTLKNMQSGEQQVYNIENLWSLPALKLT